MSKVEFGRFWRCGTSDVTRRASVRLLATAIALPIYACKTVSKGHSKSDPTAPTDPTSNPPTTTSPAPVGATTSSGSSTLNSMTLVNTGGATQAGGFITPIFGMTFRKGDIPSGTAPQFQVGGVSQPYSWGLQSYYSDGSLRHASFMFLCSASIAANGSQTVNIVNGGTAPTPSVRTLTEVYNQGVAVGGPGIGSFGGLAGTWMGYLTNDANNVEQYVYLDGACGKAWRVKTHMAQSQGGAPHGQLEVYHYITALQDANGNLGGFRYLPRITQPYYNNDTPTKALRAFTKIFWQYGAGPTVVPLTWPFNNINFNGSSGSQTLTVAGGTHNLYSGAQAGSGSSLVNCVPGYLSYTTDPALSTKQIYFAYTFGAATNNTTFQLSTNNTGSGFINSGGGSSTFVPIPICLHGGSIYTADAQGRSNFFQGNGSMSADNTVRTQFNQAYLHSTGAVPPWNLSVNGVAFGGAIKDIPAIVGSSSSAYWTGSPAWNPVSCGPLSPAARGQTGSNLDIGPLTAWHACHFYNQSAVGDMCVRAMAFASDFDGVGSVRDVATNNYVNVSNSSYTGMPAPSTIQQSNMYIEVNLVSGFTAPSTPPANNMGFLWGGEQEYSHKPCMAFYAFLVFGEPYFYDLMIEAATGAVLEMYAPSRVPTSPAGYGIVMIAGQIGLRGRTWALRDLMLGATFAASTSPDGSQVPQYLSALATANTAWCNSLYSANYIGSALSSVNSWRTVSGDGSGNIEPSCGGFMMGYHECVMAWFATLGDSGSLTWLNDYATWLNYVITNYGGYNLYAEYDGAASVTSTSAAPPISSLSQYGILAMYDSLSWNTSSPCFTVSNPKYGYVVTAGDKYVFGSDQPVVPGGFSNWTAYYVRDVSGNSFNLAASPGGAAIQATNSGTLTPSTTPAAGEGTPWLLMAKPPAASTGNIPTGSGGTPDSYLLYRKLAWDWATCAGASGYSNAVADATARLTASFPDFSGQANWYSQPSL